jgi:hypothetical protein
MVDANSTDKNSEEIGPRPETTLKDRERITKYPGVFFVASRK